MVINETISNLTNQELISISHGAVIQNVLFIWLITIFVFLFIGMVAIKTKSGKGKYFWIWFGCCLITGFIVGIIVFRPEWIQNIFGFFSP